MKPEMCKCAQLDNKSTLMPGGARIVLIKRRNATCASTALCLDCKRVFRLSLRLAQMVPFQQMTIDELLKEGG